MISLATIEHSNAQLIGIASQKINDAKRKNAEKNYVPIFEREGKKPSNPSTLSMHSKYVGKIVFSDQKLTQENTKEELFKSSFNFGDPIYARVFTSNSVENYMTYDKKYGQTPSGEVLNTTQCSYTVFYYIDNVELIELTFDNRFEYSGINSWQQFVFNPDSKSRSDFNREKVIEYLYGLSPGIHKVKVVIWAGRNEFSIKPIAEGEFDLNVVAGAKIKTGIRWSDANWKAGDLSKDPKIKSKITELYTDYLKTNFPNLIVKDIKIISDGFGIYKDEYGIIKSRYLRVDALVVDPSKSGRCFSYNSEYLQDYSGGGTYSDQFYRYRDTPKKLEIDCE